MKQLNEAQEALAVAITLLLSGSKQSGGTESRMFYAHFIQRMNIEWCDKKVPTAGVWVTDRINMAINPEFFMGLTPIERQELLIHEVEHIVYLHPFRSKDYMGADLNQNNHKLFNIAADAYINQGLPNLTANLGVTYDRLNDELKKLKSKDRVNGGDLTEVTYEILKRNQMTDENSGYGEIDDHSTWQDSSESSEVAKAIIADAANKAAQATGAGNMPSSILKQLEALNKASVNWKRELRRFFVNSLKFDWERTRNKRNRRTGLLNPGKRKKPNLKVAVCVDSSGSVYDEAFEQFFGEIAAISDMGVDITVIDADCAVAAVYKYDKKKKVERHGNGGTAYAPAIDKAKELGVDGIIYFGDMDSSDTPKDPKVPFLWAVVGQQNPPAKFAKSSVVRVDVQRK